MFGAIVAFLIFFFIICLVIGIIFWAIGFIFSIVFWTLENFITIGLIALLAWFFWKKILKK
ncbi:MAG: hypothetical protein FWC41_10335 [Firmicutes bacterium]|nr:hypothetical protein [Bacillota bacterium]